MITPRRITLTRAPDLAAFRTTLTEWILALPPEQVRDTCVLVPTGAAAEQLRRTVEDRALCDGRTAVIWPVLTTRRELYDELAARLASPPTLLSPFEREVLLSAACRTVAESGLTLPYDTRPALIAEMLALYDQVRRLGRSIDDFERNFRRELEKEQDTDRGAARLLGQTLFLAAAYRAYEARMLLAGRQDEHVLRERLMRESCAPPVHRVVVSVADRLADPDGLWPADFDLLSRLPGLERIDVLCTEGILAAGFIERLYAAFPDLDAVAGAAARPAPVLVTPAQPTPGTPALVSASYRDREEELAAVAKRLKQGRRAGTAAPLHRTALVVRRPLPYLYLARDVFGDAGVPFEALDTLPLAAEPYAAAVDLVLEAVASDFTRASLLALLRSPHFEFDRSHPANSHQPSALKAERNLKSTEVLQGWDEAIAACDFALAEARYLGGLDRLVRLVEQWSAVTAPASREERRRQTALPGLRPLLHAALALEPLCRPARLVDHITTLTDWLERFDRRPSEDEETRSRRLRVRGAVLGALTALRSAYERHDPDAQGDAAMLSAAMRRWLGSQTFAARTGTPGLQILDAQAARYGEFDDVQLVGLIEGEWPERTRRNVLYPASLLTLLEPLPAIADPTERERDALKSARAQFRDLVFSAADCVRLSSFSLEHDAVVEPSVLLDDVPTFGLAISPQVQAPSRVAYSDALALNPRRADVLAEHAAAWGVMRLGADGRPAARLRGDAGAWRLPRVSISRLELFLNCPFKFFAAQVLKLEEQPEDEAIQTPLERGRFLHDLWERFFAEWQRRGHGRIDPDHFDEARRVFAEISEAALSILSPAEAALERQRLLGSAVDPGIAHRVFAMEASRPVRILERLLEFPLEGEFVFNARDGTARTVPLNAKTDRIDVLADGTIRVIDYKSKNTPDLKVALQLPIYARLAREVLERTRGALSLGEALYLSFEGDKAVVPLRPPKGQTLDAVVADAEDRALRALDRIRDGQFPVRPLKKSLCGPCSFRAVCRLEIVEANEDAADD
ncbi:MAG TPA: PD-(D/E)XK nuclease family protein [Vicinamibacterales bacterium]|nr:PD-(D/E)XK nuclease family protein [Vicinamibacterales bacterium]